MEYNLKFEDLEIVINSKGAEQEHLYCNGKDYMRIRDEYWNRKAPILFPVVGKLKDLKTYINGDLFSIPPHGFARDREFEIFMENEHKVVFVQEYNDDTLRMYPYKYELFVSYSIYGKKLKVRYNVVNKGLENMYFNIGGHPGFKVPMNDNESFSDYKIVFEEEETFNAPSVTNNGLLDFDHTTEFKNIKELPLDYKYFVIDAIVIKDIKSKSVQLVNKEGKGIQFNLKNFNTLAIWTRPNAPFVCLEPWKGYADKYDSDYDFMKKDDLVCLRRNESYTFGYDIVILD